MMGNNITIYPGAVLKAWAVTLCLAVLGAYFLFTNTLDWKTSAPLVIFYAVITINTFFSIKVFSSLISPQEKIQWMIDIFLLLCYAAMAYYLQNPLKFALFAAILFAIATIKYSSQLGKINCPNLLKYKIIIDGLGTLSCVLAVGGMIFGYVEISAWTWSILFVLANLFIFFIKPLYVLPANN